MPCSPSVGGQGIVVSAVVVGLLHSVLIDSRKAVEGDAEHLPADANIREKKKAQTLAIRFTGGGNPATRRREAVAAEYLQKP